MQAENRFNTKGDESGRIVFQNSKLGKPYQYTSDGLEINILQDKVLDYFEMEVPNGGLLITAGIDVQHDRFAIVIRAWGTGEDSWLIFWGEMIGNVTDKEYSVYTSLENKIFHQLNIFRV